MGSIAVGEPHGIMSRFIIACGGSGGHLAPGIAIAEALIKEGHRCWLLVSKKGIDARMVESYPHLDFVKVPGAPFNLSPQRLALALYRQAELFFRSLGIFRRIRPDVVVAFGGFVSFGVVVTAYLRGLPIAFHESNRVPGKVTYYLRRLAGRIYLPEGVRLSGVRSGVVKYCGYPIRRSLQRGGRRAARERLGIDVECKLLTVIGGSQGASPLNYWVRENLESLAKVGVSVYCITGPGKGRERVEEFSSPDVGTARGYFVPFSDRMGDVLSSSDLAVARAGAGTIAELIYHRIPSILVPYPFAADQHQTANARHLEARGCALLNEEADLPELRRRVVNLITDGRRLREFQARLDQLDEGDSATQMAQDLAELCLRRGGELKKSGPTRGEMLV